MKRKRVKDERNAIMRLADDRADMIGEAVATTIRLANLLPRWYRWTQSLALAMTIERAIVRRGARTDAIVEAA